MYDKLGRSKFGEKVQSELDDEIITILKNQMVVAKHILNEKKEIIEELVQLLLEKKTLNFGDIYSVLGDRPFAPPSNFKRFLEEFHKSQEEDNKLNQDNTEEVEEVTQNKE